MYNRLGFSCFKVWQYFYWSDVWPILKPKKQLITDWILIPIQTRWAKLEQAFICLQKIGINVACGLTQKNNVWQFDDGVRLELHIIPLQIWVLPNLQDQLVFAIVCNIRIRLLKHSFTYVLQTNAYIIQTFVCVLLTSLFFCFCSQRGGMFCTGAYLLPPLVSAHQCNNAKLLSSPI